MKCIDFSGETILENAISHEMLTYCKVLSKYGFDNIDNISFNTKKSLLNDPSKVAIKIFFDTEKLQVVYNVLLVALAKMEFSQSNDKSNQKCHVENHAIVIPHSINFDHT